MVWIEGMLRQTVILFLQSFFQELLRNYHEAIIYFRLLSSHLTITAVAEYWQFYRQNKPKTMNILCSIQSNNSIIL